MDLVPGSRFHDVAELLDVCWLEVRGKISTKMLSPGMNYAAFLVFTCKTRVYGFDHQPVEAHVSISGQESEKRTICLNPEGERRQRYQIVPRRLAIVLPLRSPVIDETAGGQCGYGPE